MYVFKKRRLFSDFTSTNLNEISRLVIRDMLSDEKKYLASFWTRHRRRWPVSSFAAHAGPDPSNFLKVLDYTVVLIRIKRVPLIVLPANDLNEFCDEARYTALENGRVAAYYILVVDLGLIILMHHCKKRLNCANPIFLLNITASTRTTFTFKRNVFSGISCSDTSLQVAWHIIFVMRDYMKFIKVFFFNIWKN